ncbi:cupin domain-containing protein [Spirillospora sp. CA-108201]
MTGQNELNSQKLTLDWLLHPVDRKEFFRSSWETRPLLITRGDGGYFDGLPGLDVVDELINATSLDGPGSGDDVRLVRADQKGGRSERRIGSDVNGTPGIHDVYRAYHEGYTVVVNRIHCKSIAAATLSRALESLLQSPVGINLYLTPRHGQGFRPHVDNHDVFILQLHGAKEWRIGTPLTALPLSHTKEDVAELDDARQFTLRPGDTLYLPRGFPHEAVTSTSSSLHLTVGVNVFRWLDLMIEALSVLAEEDVRFRSALPPGFLDTDPDPACMAELAGSFMKSLSEGSITERARARFGTKLLERTRAAAPSHFRSLDAIEDLTCESQVKRTPGLLSRTRSTTDGALIEFATNFVSGPSFLGPALKFVADSDDFRVSEMPGELSPQDKIDLVARLVSEGLLQIVDNFERACDG